MGFPRPPTKQRRKNMNNNGLLLKTLSILNFSLLATLLLLSHAEAMKYKTTQITDNNYYDGDPQINKQGQIVWIAVHENYNPTYSVYYELFLWDKGKLKCIATNICSNGNLISFDLNDNGQIVWFQYNESKSKLQIYLYSDGNINNISNNNYDNINPRINNNGQVVWSLYDGSKYNVRLYDKGNISLIQINSPGPQRDLQINGKGHIVWLDPTVIPNYGVVYQVHLYKENIDSLITNNMFDKAYLRINNNGKVVWSMRDGPPLQDDDIYSYDSGITNKITYTGLQKINLQINDNGQIVWDQQPLSGVVNNDIFVYDNGTIKQINKIWEDNNPRINNYGEIVWQGSDSEAYQYDIFLNKNGITKQITSDSIQKMSPKINDNGHIVWEGGAGENTEIYLAIPIPDISAINMLLMDD